ncbi:MAG: hypothetical protein ACP5QI_05225, partial [Candidatus Bathyarchaeia archaeon]
RHSMVKIGEAGGVEVYSYWNGFFSFANSPYYAHRRLSAVDIYPPRGLLEALSPVDGRIRFVKAISSGMDYAIILESLDDPNVSIKILHVRPELGLKPGDKVGVGEGLGRIVWSPFYDFWTDPHIHVEVRPTSDPLRARGGFELNLEALTERLTFNLSQEAEEPSPKALRVEEVNERYALLKGAGSVPCFASPFQLSLKGFTGYLEGGIPHYGHCATIGIGGRPKGTRLKILGVDVFLDYSRRGYLHFKYEKVKVKVNGEPYRGLSVYMNDRYVKLIPLKIGGINLREGDEAIIKLG